MARAMVLLGMVFLASCSGGMKTEDDEAAFADGPTSIGGTSQYTALIAEGATPAALLKASQEFCSDHQFCQIMGWQKDENRPQAMPMVERESDTIAFNYSLNRATSYENAMWDCRIWKGEPKVCLEPEAS